MGLLNFTPTNVTLAGATFTNVAPRTRRLTQRLGYWPTASDTGK